MAREHWNAAALIVGVVMLAVGGPWIVREIRELPDARVLAARADSRIVSLEVAGMTCSGCAARVQSELAATPGVSEAQVQLTQERAVVVCERGVADTTLVAAVRRAGPGFQAAVLRH